MRAATVVIVVAAFVAGLLYRRWSNYSPSLAAQKASREWIKQFQDGVSLGVDGAHRTTIHLVGIPGFQLSRDEMERIVGMAMKPAKETMHA